MDVGVDVDLTLARARRLPSGVRLRPAPASAKQNGALEEDIIRTVAISPAFVNVGALAMIGNSVKVALWLPA